MLPPTRSPRGQFVAVCYCCKLEHTCMRTQGFLSHFRGHCTVTEARDVTLLIYFTNVNMQRLSCSRKFCINNTVSLRRCFSMKDNFKNSENRIA